MIRYFKDISKEHVAIAGGKGASLGEMTANGITIPSGFVILTDAFEYFLKESGIDKVVESLLKQAAAAPIEDISIFSNKIQHLITATAMPGDAAIAILNSYESLGSRYVAVRSSATAEDGDEASWAGELDSFLNTTQGTLLKNVQQCWASLFTVRAMLYRIEKNLQESFISVAVVVQKMVDSEVAGIAFSVHPISLNHDQIIIDAGLGLGEAIVSGSVTPDSYTVSKTDCNIIDSYISHQTKKVIRGKNGGTIWSELPPSVGAKQKLSDKNIKELAELVMVIEAHYGEPCDIEWAIENGQLYILQCRPITTLRGRLIDVVDARVYEDNSSIVIEKRLADLYNDSDWEIQKVSAVPLFLCCATSPLVWSKKDFLSTQYKHHMFTFVDGRGTIAYDINDWVDISERYYSQILMQNEIEGYIAQHEADYRLMIEEYSVASELEGLIDQARRACHGLSKAMGFAHAIEGITYGSEQLLKRAVAGKSLTEREFGDLCAPVYKSFSSSAQELLWQIRECENKEKQKRLVDSYIERFYWHEGSYFGSSQLTPADVMVRANALSTKPEFDFESRRREKDSLIQRLGLDASEAFIVTTIEECFRWQDDRKMYILESINHLDSIIRKLAETLSIDYILLKYALPQELILENLKSSSYKERLLERSKGCVIYMTQSTVNIVDGAGYKRLAPRLTELGQNVENSKTRVRGLSASGGLVRGVVRVCESLDEISLVQDGEILVASMTRPEYLSAMLHAAAFVTDEGGITCHAAIIAREMEKPCVIGTKNATNILKTGMKVEVNGDKGFVRILE